MGEQHADPVWRSRLRVGTKWLALIAVVVFVGTLVWGQGGEVSVILLLTAVAVALAVGSVELVFSMRR